MRPGPADWQLPRGVNRSLWDYVHDASLARAYDHALAGSHLLSTDLEFARRHLERPGRLLDVGCGTGRLLLPFAERGFWVVGVDLSEEMLQVVREKAMAAGLSVERVKANLVELGCFAGASFDYAACLFSTLGMIDGVDNRRQALAHIYRVLRPGGKFLLHVHNLWFNFWDPQGRRWLFGDRLQALLGKQAGDRHMPPHQGLAGLTLHLFTRRETLRLLRDAGFRILEIRPVSLRADGRLAVPWWLGWLRAYGYLIAAQK